MSHPDHGTQTVYGLRAALAVAQHRPRAIKRAFHTEARRTEVAPILKACAQNRVPYREVDDEEMGKIAKTVHHEGIIVVTDPIPLATQAELTGRMGARGVMIALDHVGNPHNLGAILRNAAWFGAAGILIPADDRQATLSAAAVRVAQGAAEMVPVAAVRDLPGTLRRFQMNEIQVVAADQNARPTIWSFPYQRRVCLVMGAEDRGLRPATRAATDGMVRIPGGHGMESLNVAVASGIMLAAVTRPKRK